MATPRFLSGQLLLALPGIGDPRFERAVIAMCSHDEDGALGIGIGRVVPGLGFHQLLAQLGIAPGAAPDVPVHIGGPVEPQRGFVLHTQDWGGEDTIHIGKRWCLTGTLDVLRALAENRGPGRWLVALGYAGWAAGQLDEEMTRHGWFACAGEDDLLFNTLVEDRWAAGYAGEGIDAKLLAPTAGHA